jgi:hypothetical protein
MDRFLRGEEGLISLLTPHIPFTLQSQLDQKVHRDDHAAHATTLTTHATTLGTLDSGKQDTITADNAGDIKTALGLTNVNNTTDAAKPVSDATQTALNGKLSISGVVTPLVIKTQSGGVNSPALTLFHSNVPTTASYTGLELKVKNTSYYGGGYHEPSVKQVYEYNNGDILGDGSTGNITNRVFYQFMYRIGTSSNSPLSGGAVLHTGPYFNSDGVADFAGGTLTGVASLTTTGVVNTPSVTNSTTVAL